MHGHRKHILFCLVKIGYHIFDSDLCHHRLYILSNYFPFPIFSNLFNIKDFAYLDLLLYFFLPTIPRYFYLLFRDHYTDGVVDYHILVWKMEIHRFRLVNMFFIVRKKTIIFFQIAIFVFSNFFCFELEISLDLSNDSNRNS